MRKIKKNKRRYIKRRILLFLVPILVIFTYVAKNIMDKETPEQILIKYMNHIPNKEYEEMYSMISSEKSEIYDKESYLERNSSIYEGIDIKNMKINVIDYDRIQRKVSYETSFDTIAGNISFENEAYFTKGKKGYELIWKDSLIFPELKSTDKVRVVLDKAKRGNIVDRNGNILAGESTVYSVGVVPYKLKDKNKDIDKIAELLNIDREVIENKLSAKWVKKEHNVPIKMFPKVEEFELLGPNVDEEIIAKKELYNSLLEIPGVSISEVKARQYPLGKSTAHLIGYVGNVTAEDLEKNPGEGYMVSSEIGKSGLEYSFEKKLKGQNGARIFIEDSNKNEKCELSNVKVTEGDDVKLTIDSELQQILYEKFKDDKSCSVAINPYTGEVLALVSTPSFDSNDFIYGLSNEDWEDMNEDQNKPLYNRFRQSWCPGSVLKPIIASIGLEEHIIDPDEDYGNVGLSWQKDSSWGTYYITTLHAYSPVNLENALVYSDNIYFAKSALKIGSNKLESAFKEIGFNKEIPFEIKMKKSSYSNTDEIESEIQLADTGYGQGQVLVNPLHLACMYSAFCNNGDIIEPHLSYGQKEKAVLKSKIFTKDTINAVVAGMKKVVNSPEGTGYSAHRNDMILAGKTGTAEIKKTKEDDSGTELGWFSVFTTDMDSKKPILIISMVEDVKGRGGSNYVVKKDSEVIREWFNK